MASKLASNKSFDGEIIKYKIESSKTLGGLPAQFNIFLPKESKNGKVPVLYYLAGLTCNEDTGPWKGGFLRDAASEGIAMIFPDTSPRGAGVENEDDSWDFGTGAGFYLNATHPKWKKHYNMKDFITKELPATIDALGLPVDIKRASIMGHSMGGHGALTLYLSSLSDYSASGGTPAYRSCSAFSPICNPVEAPWGKKAFGGPDGKDGYLQNGLDEGKQWDATELIRNLGRKKVDILIDVGLADNFYKDKQLLPENLLAAVKSTGIAEEEVTVRLRDGYDHSYYFISTYAPEHISWHAKYLKS